MRKDQKHIALLIFSRTIKEEAHLKQFAGKHALQSSHQSIASALFHKTVQLGDSTGLPCFLSLGDTQKGDCFGERLANEVKIIFNKGYQQLIIIGTDCPQLSINHIAKARKMLQNGHNTVIGKSYDQGAYLIGLRKSQFNYHQFKHLAWQSHSLLDQWSDTFEDTYFLAALRDIDSAQDLKQFLKTKSFYQGFQKLLISLLYEPLKKTLAKNPILKLQKPSSTLLFRGPPIILQPPFFHLLSKI